MARVQCWHCGAAVPHYAQPIKRLTECPACHADLHCCRMCRFYDPKVLGECTHDRAERVLEKEHGNFCTHYRPRSRSFQASERDARNASTGALNALFGVDGAGDSIAPQDVAAVFGPELPPASAPAGSTGARRALDALFQPAAEERKD